MVVTAPERVDAARVQPPFVNDAPSRVQPHIQGLRAVAVLSVVLYHFWPSLLPGGYVGVDVFFVISGFLICGHLNREIESTGTVRLLRFWARRIRRLIPAAATVLVVTGAFVLVLLPTVEWQQNMTEIRAAALYVENWQLVANAVDYLASQSAPSLVQHFWSLSVEEQFYFFAPLLLLAVVRFSRSRRAIIGVLVAAIVLSLPYAAWTVATAPGTAYFSTGSRAWEFAIGGVAAVLAPRITATAPVRIALGWAGLAVIIVVTVAYTSSTPFPGLAALLPVIGAALALLFAGTASRVGPAGLLAFGPVRTIGDWSYSIYLWHWPLLIGVPLALGRPAGWRIKLALLLLTLLLAAFTKRYVEDLWRRSGASAPAWKSFVPMLALFGCVAIGTTAVVQVQGRAAALQVERAQAAVKATSGDQCLGIQAVVNHCASPYAVTASVVPAAAEVDVPWNIGIAASRSCSGESTADDPVVRACVFNDPAAPTETVALVGDSHADHLIDALNGAAEDHNWRFVTYTREGCSGVPSARITNRECRAWSAAVQRALQERKDVDVVIFSNYASAAEWTAGDEAAAWAALKKTGHLVVPIVDVPGMAAWQNGPKCVAAHLGEYDPCSTAQPPAGKTEAASRSTGTAFVSVNDLLCAGGRCHAVIGGEIVYMDEAHLTFHFSSSLRTVLGSRIQRVVSDSGAG